MRPADAAMRPAGASQRERARGLLEGLRALDRDVWQALLERPRAGLELVELIRLAGVGALGAAPTRRELGRFGRIDLKTLGQVRFIEVASHLAGRAFDERRLTRQQDRADARDRRRIGSALLRPPVRRAFRGNILFYVLATITDVALALGLMPLFLKDEVGSAALVSMLVVAGFIGGFGVMMTRLWHRAVPSLPGVLLARDETSGVGAPPDARAVDALLLACERARRLMFGVGVSLYLAVGLWIGVSVGEPVTISLVAFALGTFMCVNAALRLRVLLAPEELWSRPSRSRLARAAARLGFSTTQVAFVLHLVSGSIITTAVVMTPEVHEVGSIALGVAWTTMIAGYTTWFHGRQLVVRPGRMSETDVIVARAFYSALEVTHQTYRNESSQPVEVHLAEDSVVIRDRVPLRAVNEAETQDIDSTWRVPIPANQSRGFVKHHDRRVGPEHQVQPTTRARSA